MGEHEYRPPPDDLDDRIRSEVEPEARARRASSNRWGVVAVAFAVVLAGFGFNAWTNQRQERELGQQSTVLAAQKDQLDAVYTVGKQLERQLRASGETPAAPPVDEAVKNPAVVNDPVAAPDPVQIPGPAGEPGRPPSAAEVSQAVSRWCSVRNECVGRDGAPGADGTDATPTQVAEAVATYCNSRGECQGLKGADSQVPGPAGKDGTDGVDGVDGADSQVPGPMGPAGPGPSDAQVLGAVTAYCGQDSKPCVGPTGPEGPQGKPGYPTSWTFTFLAQTYLCVDADGDHDYTCEPT